MRANNILLGTVLLLFISCQRKEKYCYYEDSNGCVDWEVYTGDNLEQAKTIDYLYRFSRPYGRDEISKKANRLKIFPMPKVLPLVDVIRYYPEYKVAKVVFKRNLTTRIGSPTERAYVPMLLLHDTPPNDSVKYIDPQEACVIEILLSEEEKSFFARTYAGGQLEVEQSRIVYDKDRFPLEYIGTLNYKKANGELIKTGITVWSKAFPNPYSRMWETYLYRNQDEGE